MVDLVMLVTSDSSMVSLNPNGFKVVLELLTASRLSVEVPFSDWDPRP